MSKMLEQLQLLTGQQSTLKGTFEEILSVNKFDEGDIGVSQLNELLLAAGFDRVTHNDFFALLYEGKPVAYQDGMRIHGLDDLAIKVDAIRKVAALKYGNFKFAFKRWSQMNKDQLEKELTDFTPRRPGYYQTRTPPLQTIEKISIEESFSLGYITRSGSGTHEDVVKKAQANFSKYLTFDHIDVYVATSMRRYRDFVSVNKLIDKVFEDPTIKELKVRYFDPTQVYSPDRLRKGLLETLMLKRAKCTIYCVQETDTLGKDSELATTLAQGKPVLAYVPKITDLKQYEEDLLADSVEEGKATRENPLTVLRRYLVENFPREVLKKPLLLQTEDLRQVAFALAELSQQRFDERAKNLSSSHPLALQVDLSTGVAHGVLLVRTPEDCARLLRKVLLRELDYYLQPVKPDHPEFACGDYTMTYVLFEKTTKSPYRVVIGDELLTNSFWNFYLK